MTVNNFLREPARDTKIVAKADVVVVGGGPAGVAAALAAARNGAQTILLERYNHLGGLASGGMVLILDDMWDASQHEISVRGTCLQFIERLSHRGLAVYPKSAEWRQNEEAYRKWARWGTFDFHSHQKPRPVCFAVAFDPDGWKRVSLELVRETGVQLRLHSWFSSTIVEDGVVKGVVCETKNGREAILGDVVIDATGDLDVAASAGAPYIGGSYIMTTVFRIGGVDTDTAERFEFEDPVAYAALDRTIKQMLGGAWAYWWLKTPLKGIVWCNCPHLPGYNGIEVEDLTKVEMLGREIVHEVHEFAKKNFPGFQSSYVVDFASQTGVRQTRLLQGEYVMTKDDIMKRVRFPDAIARGRDYYYPYRSLLPKKVDNLLIAGRHYSSTSQAQKMSREIPPCMAMGEAAGVAAVQALNAGKKVRDIDVGLLQRTLRVQGADPGDRMSPNPDIPALAESASIGVAA